MKLLLSADAMRALKKYTAKPRKRPNKPSRPRDTYVRPSANLAVLIALICERDGIGIVANQCDLSLHTIRKALASHRLSPVTLKRIESGCNQLKRQLVLFPRCANG